MTVVQTLMDRLRPLVGLKGWDYCVLWKLSDDQRFIAWIDCCCAGIEGTQNDDGDELHFPVSPFLPCRDVIFPHPRTKSCELLSQLPSSMPLDSGIYAQSLISNQPRWLNFSNSADLEVMEETLWTRVLIPIMGGLIELFATKEVSEEPHVIDFIIAQCNISMEQDPMNMNTSCYLDNASSSVNVHAMALENSDVPYELSVDRIRICSGCTSPVNFLQQFGYSSSSKNVKRHRNDVFFEGSRDDSTHQNGIQEMDNASNMNMQFMEPNMGNKELQQGNYDDLNKDLIKPDQNNNNNNNGRSDSISDCSDQIDDLEDDVKYRPRRNGKEPQSKNLVAERKRRKKLNDRLYALRALVPIITKLDRATILVDAIEYVKQLQKQEKELKEELEENSDDDGAAKNDDMGISVNNHNAVKSESLTQNGTNFGPKTEPKQCHMGNGRKQDQDSENTIDKGQQMEVQVEVAQLNGNEFFIKVFCEHKPGGFVRLMEALNSLGLEVTNANVTSRTGLVSNVFNVKKRDNEMVQADHVRDSLLELTRNPAREWIENVAKASDSTVNNGINYHHHEQHLHSHHMSTHHHHLHHN
ncbi:transcription factor ABORTED MICROSPORES [Citrus sinensis]|nr:transcription factor ABORTED MICROSPORES [Citrus x clementina]XP_052288484.1 transcription factor ABORTED MICROSPORES [Citrus sinensis]KAH9655134.1 transcription factor ABORTED MICROSPORES [Citrus sinensis]